MRERLLVLESCWDHEDFSDKRTVKPFIEGWSAEARVGFVYRTFHSRTDLALWLQQFYCDESSLDTCYIAGHGLGTRLMGLGETGINLTALLVNDIFRKGKAPGAVNTKGILVGACQCCPDHVRQRIIEKTNRELAWIAGYSVDLPWTESTLCDLLFLQERFRGRVRRNSPTGDLDQRDFGNIKTVTNWVLADFPMAQKWGFGVAMRSNNPRKEKPRWRRNR